MSQENDLLKNKYSITALFYDILDYPWERQYRQWRPELLKDVRGKVLEAGVGTGRNLKYYLPDVQLTGIDLSPTMLKRAEKRAKDARCKVTLKQEDATLLSSIPSNHFDWIFSTFICCVMPDQLQPLAIQQFGRVLKPGGRFRLLEMIYSKNLKVKKKQERFAPFVEKVYGARFDRNTLHYIQNSENLKVGTTSFLKDDVYLLIDGVCEKTTINLSGLKDREDSM